ncbi:MAG: RNA-binding S4 domain-containing protein [Verrucomicrobia bacterium]|nr:MAG: RNA-binding S4 domain-containing protein [Verrucomicrobiota bacterium]
MRLDQWLWCVRLYKSRSIAVEAIRAGHVKIGDAETKPAREVHPGDVVHARVGDHVRVLKAIGAPRSRVSAREVPGFAEDLTPPPVPAPPPGLGEPMVARRPRGAGRPTKRERRQIDGLLGA